jgi:hypothetical protein
MKIDLRKKFLLRSDSVPGVRLLTHCAQGCLISLAYFILLRRRLVSKVTVVAVHVSPISTLKHLCDCRRIQHENCSVRGHPNHPFPTVSKNKMAEAGICDTRAPLAPLA